MRQDNWQEIIEKMQGLFLNPQDESIETLIKNLKTLEKSIKAENINMPYRGAIQEFPKSDLAQLKRENIQFCALEE